jgi:glycerol-3-phosphate acyltransferase PlsY
VAEWLAVGAILASAYLIGSVPVGAVVVRLSTGKNVLYEHSGRTGGTNVMRTAGAWAGLLTAMGDLLKGAAAVYLAQSLAPAQSWVHVSCGALAVLGHNHSIFLPERSQGRIRLRGGAGGATALGCGIALSPIVAWVVPVALLVLYRLGYASVTTLLSGVLMTAVLVVEANAGAVPWAYVGYGVAAEALMLLALRPNLDRLRRGEERLVGWRARSERPRERSKPAPLSQPKT